MSEQELVWYEDDPFCMSLFVDKGNSGELLQVGNVEKSEKGPWYTTEGCQSSCEYDIHFWKTLEDARNYLEQVAKSFAPTPTGVWDGPKD